MTSVCFMLADFSTGHFDFKFRDLKQRKQSNNLPFFSVGSRREISRAILSKEVSNRSCIHFLMSCIHFLMSGAYGPDNWRHPMYDQMPDRGFDQRPYDGRQGREMEYHENDDHFGENMRPGRPPSIDSDRRMNEFDFQRPVC